MSMLSIAAVQVPGVPAENAIGLICYNYNHSTIVLMSVYLFCFSQVMDCARSAHINYR
jgi:predicted transcriptional regulator YheO